MYRTVSGENGTVESIAQITDQTLYGCHKVFYNPSAIDVWVERNKKDIICIPAGQTITVE